MIHAGDAGALTVTVTGESFSIRVELVILLAATKGCLSSLFGGLRKTQICFGRPQDPFRGSRKQTIHLGGVSVEKHPHGLFGRDMEE